MFKKKMLAVLLALAMLAGMFAGCNNSADPNPGTSDPDPVTATGTTPKYIFYFIGDGMGLPAITALANYRGTMEYDFKGTLAAPTPENQPTPIWPSFVDFPVLGMASTADSSKFITDSASGGTALATGVKTLDGVIGKDAFLNDAPNIAEILKDKLDYKVGIITSVSIDHATPASFYAHVESRNQYYDIAMQGIASDVDLLAGGTFTGIADPRHKEEKDLFEAAEEAGWTICNTRDKIAAVEAGAEKVMLVDEFPTSSYSLQYAIDQHPDGMRLYEYVETAVEVLDNDNGFFIICEGGQIDWAEHVNDAFTAMGEIGELELAVDVAIKFYNEHPDETLIIVTADHETGGLVNGYNQTHYNTYYEVLSNQTASYYTLYWMRNQGRDGKMDFDGAMEVVRAKYGLIRPDAPDAADYADGNIEYGPAMLLTEREMEILREAWELSLTQWKGEGGRNETRDERYNYMFAPLDYEPWSLSVTRMLNARAGIGWTTTSHSGSPVPVFAMGVQAELFDGMLDNTDIFKILTEITGTA